MWKRFSNKEYRDGFVEGTVGDTLAVQIYNLRRDRGWTQSDLAGRMGTGQTAICRLEAGTGLPSVTTLLKAASAFDVALSVKFIPFSQVLVGDGDAIDKEITPFKNDCLPPEREPIRFIWKTEDELNINMYKLETGSPFANENLGSGELISCMVH